MEGIQGGQSPVHRRIGGKTGFQCMDMTRQILKTFFDGIKPGKGSEQGKMRSPDMGGNKNRPGTGFQCDFQKIPAVQTEDRPE